MGLSYFSRHLSDTSESPGLGTQRRENSNCAAWEDRDALGVMEKSPITQEEEEKRVLLSLDMVK